MESMGLTTFRSGLRWFATTSCWLPMVVLGPLGLISQWSSSVGNVQLERLGRIDVAPSADLAPRPAHLEASPNVAEARECQGVADKTTIVNGTLIRSLQPVAAAAGCAGICRAVAACRAYTWHASLFVEGLESTQYSMRCFLYYDARPTMRPHSGFVSGTCAAKANEQWTCASTQLDAEKVLVSHPAMHNHLDGHEYFEKTKSVINTFGRKRLENGTFLELGYGLALAAVVLRGFDTRIYATEPYPVPWTPRRHGPFYDDLLADTRAAAVRGEFGHPFYVDKVAEFSRRCGDAVPGVSLLQTTLEELRGIPDHSVDVTYSLAVLEHISEVDSSFKTLARVMRVGGLGCHQIDMRDHGSFDRPWQFLLLNESGFQKRINKMSNKAQRHPFFGNRVRLGEFMTAASRHGFQTVHLRRNYEPATEEGLKYASDTIARLRQCADCRYRNWPREDLDGCTPNKMPMTGVFWCTRYLGAPPPPDDEQPACGQGVWTRSGFAF